MIFIQRFWSRNFRGLVPILTILAFGLLMRLVYYVGVVRGDDFGYAHAAYELSINRFNVNIQGSLPVRSGLFTPVAILYRLFGYSEFTTVLYPMLGSLMTIVIIYLITKELKDHKAGCIAAFLLACYPISVLTASQLVPDGLLALAIATAIWVYLLAKRVRALIMRIIVWLISFFALCWGFRIKESGFFVILVLIVDWLWSAIEDWRRVQSIPLLSKKRLLIGLGVSGLVGVIILFALQSDKAVLLNNSDLTATDFGYTLVRGIQNPISFDAIGAQYYSDREIIVEYFPMQDELGAVNSPIFVFIMLMPAILISISTMMLANEKSANIRFLLLWLIVSFLYMEWGSFQQNLHFPQILSYAPINHWIDIRNYLFPSLPLITAAAIYLSNAMDEKDLYKTLVVAVFLTSLIAIGIKVEVNPGIITSLKSLVALAILIAICLSFGFPFLRSTPANYKIINLLPPLLIGAISIGSLYPLAFTKEFDYYSDRQEVNNYTHAANYLLQHPGLPIIGGNRKLNFASRFQLGYDFLDQGLQYPEVRIISSDQAKLHGEYYVVREGDIPYYSLLPNEWVAAQFGSGDSQVTIFEVASAQAASKALEDAEILVQQYPTPENLLGLLRAAVMVKDISIASQAWAQFNSLQPDAFPLEHLLPLLISHASKEVPFHSSYISLEPSLAIQDWEFSDTLVAKASTEQGEPDLTVTNTADQNHTQMIWIERTLQPSTAYVFQSTVSSTMPVQILTVADGRIQDTLQLFEVRGSVETTTAFFITPPTLDPNQPVKITLFDIIGRGTLRIYDLRLYALTN